MKNHVVADKMASLSVKKKIETGPDKNRDQNKKVNFVLTL